MHVISRRRLLDFGAEYPDAREQLLEWDRIVARKRYANTAEVKADFPSVDFIGQGKAVFNICGRVTVFIVASRYPAEWPCARPARAARR